MGLPSTVVPTCPTVTTTAQRVPGATGRTFALLIFTNAGTVACTLTGRPSALLLDADRQPVTAPASDGDGTATPVALAPGAAASTLLMDDASTCTADTRSAFVRVGPPGGGASQDLPLQLPPCSLSVKPVVAGTDPAP